MATPLPPPPNELPETEEAANWRAWRIFERVIWGPPRPPAAVHDGDDTDAGDAP